MRKKNTTGRPKPASREVKKKQEKDYSEDDFLKALGRTTERLDHPSESDPGSPKR